MRPKGWDELNPCEYVSAKAPFLEVFEAGADAMYNALWKMAEESPTGTFTFDTHVVNCPHQEEEE